MPHPIFYGGSHLWPGCRCLLFLFLFLLPRGGLEGKENRVVRVAFSASIISEANLNDTKLAMEIWTRKLTGKMGFNYRIEVKFFNDFPSLLKAAEKKQVDFVQLSSLDYLGLKDRTLVEPILSQVKNMRPNEPLLILVHRESSIRSLENLDGGSIIVERGSKAGDIPRFWLETILLRQKLPLPHKFFKSLEMEDNPSRAATKVYFRQADACVVCQGTFEALKELNPQFGVNLRVLAESPPLIYGFFCAVRGIEPEVRRAFMETGMKLGDEAEGRQILTLFRVDGIVPFRPELLHQCLDLYREHKKLQK
jgi:ABC-type phosphate/phosphonate transport system substrate-binding protein